jgi:hypothetical protein
MTFEVQTHTICDGWINIWHETGDDDITRAVTFETREAAEKALAEFITEIDQAVARGDLSDSGKNYRVAKAGAT